MEKLEFYLYKTDINLWHNIINTMFKAIHSIVGNVDILITISKVKRKTTSKQRAYIWGLVYPYISEGLKHHGNDDYKTLDDVHLLMKIVTNYYEKTTIKTLHGEKKGIVLKSISSEKGLKYETWEYSEACVAWALDMLGVIIPPPNGEEAA